MYKLGILAYRSLIQIASLGSAKAKKWIYGRQHWRRFLEENIDKKKRRILIHAASLGEMEQGLPILKALRASYPNHQIIVSFFSPSGYEFFRDDEYCDLKIYLPLDLPKEAEDFAKLVQPELSLFIKYEIWPNLIRALKKAGSKLLLAPAHFRANQIYFKPYAQKWLGASLQLFDSIMVQTNESLNLLQENGLKEVSLCGDSRFDRALENKTQEYNGQLLEEFIAGEKCLIVGSSWPKEEALVLDLLHQNSEFKIILAPHEVNSKNIKRLCSDFEAFKPSLWSSQALNAGSKILVIDSIGQLKFLYRFANVALIGGGFGKGVHSTVEAAVYQIPILFGPAHQKFPETQEMLNLGLAMTLSTKDSLEPKLSEALAKSKSDAFSQSYQNYLQSQSGASERILENIKELLKDE